MPCIAPSVLHCSRYLQRLKVNKAPKLAVVLIDHFITPTCLYRLQSPFPTDKPEFFVDTVLRTFIIEFSPGNFWNCNLLVISGHFALAALINNIFFVIFFYFLLKGACLIKLPLLIIFCASYHSL